MLRIECVHCVQSKDQLVADSVDPAAKLKTGDAKDNKLASVLGQVIEGRTGR